MDNQEVHQWESALDDANQVNLEDGLPKDVKVGQVHHDVEDGRKWLRVNIVRGNTGGRWAYWLKMTNLQTLDRDGDYDAVADQIFNGDAAHFIGMLSLPYVKRPGPVGSGGSAGTPSWVLVEPKMVGPVVVKVPQEPVKERYERSKEVYDVQTGETTKLP